LRRAREKRQSKNKIGKAKQDHEKEKKARKERVRESCGGWKAQRKVFCVCDVFESAFLRARDPSRWYAGERRTTEWLFLDDDTDHHRQPVLMLKPNAAFSLIIPETPLLPMVYLESFVLPGIHHENRDRPLEEAKEDKGISLCFHQKGVKEIESCRRAQVINRS
jgi:hypothetical protein